MDSPSAPLLRWIRQRIDAEGHSTASIAEALKRPRAEVRRLLSGAIPMTVDDLVRLGDVLKLDPASLGLPMPEEPSTTDALLEGGTEPVQWRNQPRVLMQVAFELRVDVLFLVDTAMLRGVWEGPDSVLDAHGKEELPIRLDAAYQRFMEPVFDDDALRLTLSFDRLYRCVFPWSAFRRVMFFPIAPEAPVVEPEAKPEPGKRPSLRLVR